MMERRPLAVGLVHHPVVDRRGDEVVAAVTNLDLHDIARTARTYGVDRFYVITPVAEQQSLVARLLEHWRTGFGAGYNPHRGEALALVKVVSTLEEALEDWGAAIGCRPLPVLTGAASRESMSFAGCRALLRKESLFLVFGTGWGLAPALFARDWAVLAPVDGVDGYNHLPVRAAAAIILDRLLGRGRNNK